MDSPIIYICDHVFDHERPIALLAHHADGMWQLTCGEHDHSIDGASIKPVHLEHVATPELAAAMQKTPEGHFAELGPDGGWHVEAFGEDEDES